MFARPKILFLVFLLFVALLNLIPTYLLNFEFFYHSSIYIAKQKQPGCKKVRGQSEATMVIGDQKL